MFGDIKFNLNLFSNADGEVLAYLIVGRLRSNRSIYSS